MPFAYFSIKFWCWIGPSFIIERFAVFYIWVWLAFFFSIILYTALFFLVRGNVTVDEGTWWRFRIHARRDCTQSEKRLRQCYSLIAYVISHSHHPAPHSSNHSYPIVYAFLVGPISIARWYSFTHPSAVTTHRAATFVVMNMFYLSGLLNALLFLLTKRGLWLFGFGEQHRNTNGVAPPVIDILSSSQYVSRAVG
jgi:hypothetical protein